MVAVAFLRQFLLLAVLHTDFHPRKALAQTSDQARLVERGDRFEAADVDLPADHIVIGQRVLPSTVVTKYLS